MQIYFDKDIAVTLLGVFFPYFHINILRNWMLELLIQFLSGPNLQCAGSENQIFGKSKNLL